MDSGLIDLAEFVIILLGAGGIMWFIEPWFLERIDHEMIKGLHKYLDPRVQKYTDPEYVKKQILQNLPETMVPGKRIAFREDIDLLMEDPYEGIFSAMQYYLVFVGKKELERIFPL